MNDSAPKPRFWQRRFAPEAAPRQILFDVLLGIVGPILRLIFDPGVFRSGVFGVLGRQDLRSGYRHGDPQPAEAAAQKLKGAFWCDTDCYREIVTAYREEQDPSRRELLARLYKKITRDDIEFALRPIID